MKIGIVCYPTFGGSGVVATELGIELSKKGHEIHFITYSQPVRLDALSSNLHYHEVNVPDYPLFKYEPYELALSSKLYDVVSKHKIDVLHVHYAIPHAYAAYMAKKILNENGYKIPIITTLHGTDITLVGNLPVYKQSVNFSINNSDYITTVSESLKNDTFNHLKNREINEELKSLKEMKETLWEERLNGLSKMVTPDWTMKQLEKVLKSLKNKSRNFAIGYDAFEVVLLIKGTRNLNGTVYKGLTGKITLERQFDKNDWRSNAGQWLPWFKRENLERLSSMFLQWGDLIDKYHCSIAQLTVAWTAAQPGISHVLCGAKSVSQIIKNANSGSITLSEGEINRIRNDIKNLGKPI